MKYYLITASEYGELCVGEYNSLDAIVKEYADNEEKLPTPIKDIKDVDPNYMEGKCLILRGEIIVPKPVKLVTTWEE